MTQHKAPAVKVKIILNTIKLAMNGKTNWDLECIPTVTIFTVSEES